ncbi:MAG: NAD(P)-dependent alcohol dehydrogenase [Lewinellaceae bacterium]|nr:NAD(P)-dependent alcohol dehydrogenase [Lewinellaceae bacterium]
MKTIVFEEYGPPEVVKAIKTEKPVPADNEVLIKVHATTVTSGDVRVRSSTYPKGLWLLGRLVIGLTKPRETGLGNELAGVVEAVGKEVKRFRVGDEVFGATGLNLGANAEYISLPEDGAIALKPANLSFEEAAAIPFGALTSLVFLRDKGQIRSGQKVLVYGASGGLGVYAVQLARYFGAEVTGVSSTKNLELVKSLGAHKVIDYTKEDFTQSGEVYDIIFDTVGKTSFSRASKTMAPKGVFLAAVAGIPEFFQMLWTSMSSGKKVIGGVAIQRKEDTELLRELLEAGRLRPVVDRRYPLGQIVEAHRYVETGRKKGAVVLTVDHDTAA